MNAVVLLKMVPDVVEELEIAADGKSLDDDVLRMILSEWCDHALEEALLLKEKHGGTVTVIAPDAAEVDDALYTALAKGADRAVKLVGGPPGQRSPSLAAALGDFLSTQMPPGPETVIFTGSQTIDDIEGELGAYLAERLNLPYLGVITQVSLLDGSRLMRVRKEFSGGMRGDFDLPLPAILGIQAAEKPPRYVPVVKVRAVMKSARIEEIECAAAVHDRLEIEKLLKPEPTGRAEMIEGKSEDVAKRIADILQDQGIL